MRTRRPRERDEPLAAYLRHGGRRTAVAATGALAPTAAPQDGARLLRFLTDEELETVERLYQAAEDRAAQAQKAPPPERPRARAAPTPQVRLDGPAPLA